MSNKDRVDKIYNDLIDVRNNILDCKPVKSLSCNYCNIKSVLRIIVNNNCDSIFTPAFNYYLIYNSFRFGDRVFRTKLYNNLNHLINYYSMIVELGNFFAAITEKRFTTLKYCYDKDGIFIDYNNICNLDELRQSMLLTDSKKRVVEQRESMLLSDPHNRVISQDPFDNNKYEMLYEIMRTLAGITFFNNQIDKYENNIKVYEDNLDQKYDDLFLQGVCRIVTYPSGLKRIVHSFENLARYIERNLDEKIKVIK